VRDWHAFVRTRLTLPDLLPEREARIVREIAVQLEDFYREAVASGLDEAEADAHAARQITDWERLARDLRSANAAHVKPALDRLADTRIAHAGTEPGVLLMFIQLIRDARFGLRLLARTPGFTIVAVLTLALGIGASSAIFSVVNGVLLRPLPYPEPDSLVTVNEIVPGYGDFSVAPANFLDWRQQNTVFERIAAFNSDRATYIDKGQPEMLFGAAVSWDLFDLLRVPPALGRTFRAEEDAPGKNTVVVISHGLWERRFGADPAVLGRAVSLNGAPSTIVGVMPRGFLFPSATTDFWRPIALNPTNASRGGHFLGVLARRKPGVSLEQARVEMKTIAERLALQYPKNSANESANVVGLHEQVVVGIRPALLTLFAAVGVVILIACANVANLLLVRASVREREIAIRAALGAGRRRLIVQLLSESLLLALAGGGLGVVLAFVAIPAIHSLSGGSIPRVANVTIDLRVLAFAATVSLATGVLFGLIPAWQASRTSVGAILKEGGRSATSAGGRRVRSVLLVGEVALSIVLLVGAILLLRSFVKLTNVDPGFRPERVLAFRVALPNASYPEDHQRIAFFDNRLQRLAEAPGVTAASMIQSLPIRNDYFLSFAIQGRPAPKDGEEPSANHRVVSPDYFKSLAIPMLRGRVFTARDVEKSPMVAVVDEAFVARYFPTEDPIGKGLDIGNGTDGFYEIVGVVGNVRYAGLERAPSPTMYVPFKQQVFSAMWMLISTDGDPAQLAGPARQALLNVDRTLPAFSITTLSNVVDESVAQRRFSMLLLAAFAIVALFLAAVGLYGVVAYTVSQRTQEIGVRMAIGAQPADVMRMVLGGGMKLSLIGLAIGLGAALMLGSLVTTMLFGVEPFDPASYGATAVVLLAVSLLACYVPARRATAVDPTVAMRQE
jgi:putative ABC transport system permease protein